jgi:peptidoglycan/xylan/chitin deacetylase (PgdA/CDA1 family)
MLTEAQLRDVHGHGVECGAHTHTHPELDRLPASRVTSEVRHSKEVLEDVLNARVSTFSYPYGYHRRSVRNAVRSAGFESACAVGQLVADESLDRFAIPRLSMSCTTTVPELRRLLERTESLSDRALVQVKQVAWRWVRRARAGKALVQKRPSGHE